MPSAPPSLCLEPRCPNLGAYKGRCKVHARIQERTRYNAETRKWYYTDAWKTLRQIVLGNQPVCVECKVQPSTEVDHITPHRGNYAMFFNLSNLQGMCTTCHGRKTQRGE